MGRTVIPRASSCNFVMSKDWSIFFIFVVLLAGAIVIQVLWLMRKRWASGGRAIAYVMMSNLLSLSLIAVVLFVLAFLLMMIVFGPLGGGPAPGSEPLMWIIIIAAVLLPPSIIFLTKRVFLALFKMQAGRSALVYSLAVTFSILAAVLTPPSLLFYLS